METQRGKKEKVVCSSRNEWSSEDRVQFQDGREYQKEDKESGINKNVKINIFRNIHIKHLIWFGRMKRIEAKRFPRSVMD